jgi:hypothetical protein
MNVTNRGKARKARDLLYLYGFPFHIRLFDSWPTYPEVCALQFFARQQRIWQGRIYSASKTLRNQATCATGTDSLARWIADQVSRQYPGTASCGQVYTRPKGRNGRPPAIEAGIRYGAGLVALDGKDNITHQDVTKIAADTAAIKELNPEYKWIQPVLVLPDRGDVKSDAVLDSALRHRVIIATTVLPTCPLGLRSNRALQNR